jgi:hypothetical protein
MLVPPNNFGLVESGIYRCTKLESDNFPFLETLRLKSVILLDAEKPPRTLTSFLDGNQVELFNLGGLKISNHHHHTGSESRSKEDKDETKSNVSYDSDKFEPIILNINKNKNDQWMLIEKNLIVKAFELLLNKTKHNLLLVDSTSTLVGILRKIQKWNFNSILNEYRIYCGGSSSSSNSYYAENFLELIEVELLSFELEQYNSKSNNTKLKQVSTSAISSSNSSFGSRNDDIFATSPKLISRNSRNISTEDLDRWIDDATDVQSIDDDEMDDDLLSASPQIPANLLKLVEQRKLDKNRDFDSDDDLSPSTSPKVNNTRFGSRSNSFSSELLLSSSINSRRKSSIDSKAIRMSNNKFRNPNSITTTTRNSFDGCSSSYIQKLKDRNFSTDFDALKQKFDYKYHKNSNESSTTYENVSTIKLKLPPESKLPTWFIRGRTFWEENYNQLNNREC